MHNPKRVALITGGTKGIGAATALALANDGIDVALVARHGGGHAETIRAKILSQDCRCELITADVASADEINRCVDEARRLFGTIDILVHAAGGPAPGTILDIDFAYWKRAFDVHVHAAFHLCRAVLPEMRARKNGVIALLSSAAGFRGCPGTITYQVVKGALPQFARALARDYGVDNIRVNCVAPGIIRTDFHDAMTPEQKQHNLKNRIPLAREGTAEQVAELIRHLVHNEYITGETVTIDGGLTMRIC